MKKWLVVSACAVLLCMVQGCGYHFSGQGPGPKPGLQRIAIPVFDNNTAEPELGSLFAGALRREFMQRGSMNVTPADDAEAVFQGVITSLHTISVAHRDIVEASGIRLTLESRLHVTMNIRCVDTQSGTVLWQDPNFTYFKVFRQVTDPNRPDAMVAFENRREALEFLAREMAIRIHDRFLSNF
jgi:hypothetical protein